jgi:hypothetical protein
MDGWIAPGSGRSKSLSTLIGNMSQQACTHGLIRFERGKTEACFTVDAGQPSLQVLQRSKSTIMNAQGNRVRLDGKPTKNTTSK